MADKQELVQSLLEVPCFPVNTDSIGRGYIKFPLSGMALLGSAISALPVSFQAVTSSLPAGKQLFKADIPAGGELVPSKGGHGYRSMKRDSKTKSFIKGQVDYVPVEGVETTNTVTVDVAKLGTAMVMMAISMQLSEVKSTQDDMMSFLELDKQAKLRANMITLSNIAADYQYNYDNEQFKHSRDIEILEIKREAEHNIQFYKDYMQEKLHRQGIIHINTEKVLNEIQTKFRYFQLALYQFSFASFIETMLLGNFEPSYLKGIAQRIRDYNLDYKEYYTEAYGLVEKYVVSSAQNRILSGASVASKFVGDKIAKSKVGDKTNIDENLISGGKKLEVLGDNIIERTMKQFTINRDCGIISFAEKIDLINQIQNEPLHIAFDKDNLYLKTTS